MVLRIHVFDMISHDASASTISDVVSRSSSLNNSSTDVRIEVRAVEGQSGLERGLMLLQVQNSGSTWTAALGLHIDNIFVDAHEVT